MREIDTVALLLEMAVCDAAYRAGRLFYAADVRSETEREAASIRDALEMLESRVKALRDNIREDGSFGHDNRPAWQPSLGG